MRKWTDEMVRFLIENAEGTFNQDLVNKINEKFNTDFTINAIYQKKYVLGIKSGIKTTWGHISPCKETQFKKGHIPHNKGKKMPKETFEKIQPTLFKKGHKVWNEREMLSERVGKDGYIEIKTDNLNEWKSKQVYIWEKTHNEKVNKNEVVIFLDGNKRNFEPANLEKLTRAELCKLNQCFHISSNPEETMSYILQARIMLARTRIAREKGLANKYGQIPEDSKIRSKKYQSTERYKEMLKTYSKKYYEKIKNDPIKYEEFRKKHNIRRLKKRIAEGKPVFEGTRRKYGV